MSDTDRIAALRQMAFDKSQFDGLAIFGSSNLIYLTGTSGASSLVIPKDGERTIYVYGVNYEHVKSEGKGFRVELIKRDENLMEKIAKQAEECKIGHMAIDALGVESWRDLAKKTRGNTKLKLKGNFVASLRAVKDEAEMELMGKAADLTGEGMKTAYEVLSPGMKEYEVAAEIEYAMRKRGSQGTAFETAVSSGPSSAFPHGGCTDRVIRQGDLIVIDFGAVYRNYRSDMTRTLVAGKPSDKQRKLHTIVSNAQEAAFKTIRAKARARDVDAAGRSLIEAAAHGDYFVHGLGHGVGLDIHEPPILNISSKEKLAAGNVVTNEPGIYLPGYGGVRIEDTVLVTLQGAERLTKGQFGLNPE